MNKTLFYVVLFFSTTSLYGQQFVYKPMNPFFGGETFNYQQMLSSATAQNPFDDFKLPSFETSTIGSFEEQINRQVLNEISNGLFGSNYGNGQLETGVYNLGSMNINIQDYFGGVTIRIIDIKTGEQTNIILPNM